MPFSFVAKLRVWPLPGPRDTNFRAFPFLSCRGALTRTLPPLASPAGLHTPSAHPRLQETEGKLREIQVKKAAHGITLLQRIHRSVATRRRTIRIMQEARRQEELRVKRNGAACRIQRSLRCRLCRNAVYAALQQLKAVLVLQRAVRLLLARARRKRAAAAAAAKAAAHRIKSRGKAKPAELPPWGTGRLSRPQAFPVWCDLLDWSLSLVGYIDPHRQRLAQLHERMVAMTAKPRPTAPKRREAEPEPEESDDDGEPVPEVEQEMPGRFLEDGPPPPRETHVDAPEAPDAASAPTRVPPPSAAPAAVSPRLGPGSAAVLGLQRLSAARRKSPPEVQDRTAAPALTPAMAGARPGAAAAPGPSAAAPQTPGGADGSGPAPVPMAGTVPQQRRPPAPHAPPIQPMPWDFGVLTGPAPCGPAEQPDAVPRPGTASAAAPATPLRTPAAVPLTSTLSVKQRLLPGAQGRHDVAAPTATAPPPAEAALLEDGTRQSPAQSLAVPAADDCIEVRLGTGQTVRASPERVSAARRAEQVVAEMVGFLSAGGCVRCRRCASTHRVDVECGAAAGGAGPGGPGPVALDAEGSASHSLRWAEDNAEAVRALLLSHHRTLTTMGHGLRHWAMADYQWYSQHLTTQHLLVVALQQVDWTMLEALPQVTPVPTGPEIHNCTGPLVKALIVLRCCGSLFPSL